MNRLIWLTNMAVLAGNAAGDIRHFQIGVCVRVYYIHAHISLCVYICIHLYVHVCTYWPAQVATQAELQQRRREACEDLDRGIHALVATVPKVGELMENTEMFVTTTTIGHELWTVLLYPPTECRRSGRSFG